MTSPYSDLPSRNFWRTGVAAAQSATVPNLYRKKFAFDAGSKIATAGSCFAQHIGRALKARGFTVLDMERPPAVLDDATAQRFGYATYSARYGNIYSVTQLLQLIGEARGLFSPADPIWEKNGRFYDAMRPGVEPNGLASPALVAEHRAYHLKRVRRMFKTGDILVFTMGLTEIWQHKESGTAYPTAPGTIAGTFDPAVHEFRNASYDEIRRDFLAFREMLHAINPDIRIILTVSPVPLAATASGDHVLAATTYSKAVLRAVAGSLAGEFGDIDYFPSFEIITSSHSRGRFFGADLRQVLPEGVATVMDVFFGEHGSVDAGAPAERADQPDADAGAGAAAEPAPSGQTAPGRARRAARKAQSRQDDVVCEEALLEAFAR